MHCSCHCCCHCDCCCCCCCCSDWLSAAFAYILTVPRKMRRTDRGTGGWRGVWGTDVTCIDAAAAVAEFISCSVRVCENFNLKFDPRNAEQALDKPDRGERGEEGTRGAPKRVQVINQLCLGSLRSRQLARLHLCLIHVIHMPTLLMLDQPHLGQLLWLRLRLRLCLGSGLL